MRITHEAKPFIKWAGGKSQLIDQLSTLLPTVLSHEPFTYIEPFVGGGAMLFHMLQAFPHIARVIINDLNPHLATAYTTIRDDAPLLIEHLKGIALHYQSLKDESLRKDFFLTMRTRFNEAVLSPIEKTALLIFLNKTCFNGLYRENSKGKFNVPFGRYANPTICNETLIYANSQLLQAHDVVILQGDFNTTEHYITPHGLHFFYFDPPYRPISNTSNFNTYVKAPFDDQRQKDLANFCHMLSQRDNCLWMLSNSDGTAQNPDDRFLEDLYHTYNIQRVYASRAINAKATQRGKISELLIRNYGQSHTFHRQ